MGEVTINMIHPWHHSNTLPRRFTGKLSSPNQLCITNFSVSPKPMMMIMMMSPTTNPISYSATISTDIPLHESPPVSFDSYLENKTRVFKAIFPDQQQLSKRLTEEEWRIKMLPIQLLFLDARLVIDMRLRCKSQGKDYPPGVPSHITKLLELKMMRWDMQGIDVSDFSLGVDGVMYPERHGKRTRLKSRVVITMSCVLPPALDLIPQHIRREAAQTVLKTVVENMKDKVNGSLVADYSKFQFENKSKSLV